MTTRNRSCGVSPKSVFFAGLLILITGQWAAAAPPPPGPSLAPMLEKVLPSVVNISTRSTVQMRRHPLLDDPFFRRFFDLPERVPRGKKSQTWAK